ncbi:MAG: acyl-CoA carboxylase subunit beta [Chloroflexi bacterium]|nr:acyl-CoA carboxylase subunit beta [Chloroflexota bacterium]
MTTEGEKRNGQTEAKAQSSAVVLEEKRARAKLGGEQKYHDRLREQNKLFVRDRLRLLLDEECFEDGLLARHLQDLPGDALVTLVGKIEGRKVGIIANDMTVKAGTWGMRTFEKWTRLQELAGEMRIPLIYLIDSAGARIDEQFDNYAGRHAWGNLFYNQIQLSGVIPQLCIMFGPSPAGSAYVPALCDTVIMVDKNVSAYIGSPRLAEMAIGEKVSMEEMGGARMHCAMSGLGDVLVANEEEAVALGKKYLRFFPDHWQAKPELEPAVPPIPGREIAEIVPEQQNVPFDVHELVERLVDAGSFLEIKKLFAPELVTGLARLGGRSIGIVANNSKVKGGVLFVDSSDKAARFIWMCNAFNIPLLFLQDISGFMIGSRVERQGIIRHGAKMLFAVAEANVPRIAVMVRKAYGGGYLAMSGSPMHPDCVIALPTAQPALMGPEAAINAVYFNKIMELPPEERQAYVEQLRREYKENIDVYSIASEGSIEAVVQGSELRDELIGRFELYSRKESRRIERRNGVMPV